MKTVSPGSGCPTVNVRSVLQYVPSFRKKLFIIHIAESLLDSNELVDALLDMDVLQEIGLRLVLVAEGDDAHGLYEESVTYELRSSFVDGTMLSDPVGGVERLRQILDRGQVPIVASGREGTEFPEEIVHAAIELKADKYIVLTEGEKVPSRNEEPIHAILESEVSQITDHISFRELLEEAADVCRRGIPRVHLLDGRRRGVLVDELFSEEGVGTMVHADTYQEIRALKEDDIPELLSMIGRSVQNAYLIERTYEDVERNLSDYYVLTLDETIVGSVAIHLYPEEKAAELACLYIKKNHEGHGYGKTMVAFAEKIAREAGMGCIFAISLSAVEFFRDRMHYAEWPRENLPEKRLEYLRKSGRDSGVFGHGL